MKKVLLKTIAAVFIGSCFLSISCSDNPVSSVDSNDIVAQDDFSFLLAVDGQTALRLEGISGAVTIIGRADFDSVIIAGTMSVGSETIEDAEEHLQYLDVEVEERAGEIFVKTIQPRNSGGRSYVVDYSIILPADFATLITNVNGCVSIDSTFGSINVDNVNGQVYLNGITASVTASLVNGQIAGTMYLPLEGSIVLSNVNGSIILNIPQTTSAAFEASIVNGGISILDLDLDNEIVTNHSVSGTLGNGDGDIQMSTINGNLTAQGF